MSQNAYFLYSFPNKCELIHNLETLHKLKLTCAMDYAGSCR